MADYNDEIDHIYRGRFEGLKNSKFDPRVEWQAFEKSLYGSLATQTPISSSSALVFQKIAATFFVAVLSTIGVNESTSNKSETIHAGEPYVTEPLIANTIAEESRTNTPEVDFNGTIAISKSEELIFEEFAVVVNYKQADWSNTALEAVNESKSAEPYFASNYDLKAFDTNFSRNQNIVLLENKGYVYETPWIEDPKLTPENPIISKWMADHVWFFRGGLRTGTGEANSSVRESSWNASPTFSFGYGVSLTDRSYMSIEIGVLRRTGNAIERVKQTEVSPIVQSFANTISNESDLVMHRGMIADQMDYIHAPIMYNYMLNQHWTASAGVFIDYLFAAQNQSITVYNTSEYVNASTTNEDVISLDGLNRLRYGAMVGIERQLFQNLSAFGHIMTPLNSAVDQKGAYELFGTANRLVDTNIGLTYQF